MKVQGFMGEHSNVKFIEKSDLKLKKLDLIKMAERALKYLYTNPVADKDYQCRFSFAPSECPPFNPLIKVDGYVDAIMEGDTESRNDVAFRMMREMLNDYDTGKIPEEKVHERLISYLTKEGYAKDVCRTHEYSNSTDNPDVFINLWASCMLLQSECMRYRQGKGDLELAKRIFEGMMSLAIRENGRAFYRYGGAMFNEEKATEGYKGHYPMVFSGFCDYWLITKDQRCWEFMTELAEGFVLDLTPDHLHKGNGRIEGHNHVQMHAIRGFAQFAYLSGEVRYLSWVKAIYDYYREWAIDTGWIPEIRSLSEHSTHSETCLNGDMFETELWLALAGYDELWDRIERDLRNYFNVMQFELTDDLLSWFKNIHSDKTEAQINESISILKDLEGGFISAMTPNDYVFEVESGKTHFGMVEHGGKNIVFDMMGCCPPEGMRSIYYAWKYAQQSDENNVTVYLPIDSESDTAKVESNLPNEAKITVTMKKSASLKLRVPAWIKRDSVKLSVNGNKTEFYFGGTANNYVCVDSLNVGDTVILEYGLVDFYQKVTVKYFELEPKDYTYHWIGNCVASVEPKGEYLPVYEFNK